MRLPGAKIVGWGLVGVAFVLTLPTLVVPPGPGLDPSYKLALHLARDRGLVAGRDFVFTYGPWGFLNTPLTLTRSLWLTAVVAQLAVHLALFSAVGLWMHRCLRGWVAYLPAIPLVLLVPASEYRLLLALALWLRILLDPARSPPVWTGALLGVIGAATAMVKFSMGLAAAMVVAGAVGAALWTGRRRSALSLVLGFGVGLVLCGLVALGSFGAFRTFLSTSLEVAIGYSVALERQGPLWQPLIVLAAFGLSALGVLKDRRLTGIERVALTLPFLGLLLITFKHAFVRQETHAIVAFAVWGVVLTWVFIESVGNGSREGRMLRALGALVMLAGAMVAIPPTRALHLPRNLYGNLANAVRAERETRDPGFRDRVRRDLQRQLPLSEQLRSLIGDRSVDVLTREIAVMEAWDLNWTPRRVLQSYAVTTSKLDALDAEHFAGADAPSRLLVELQGLDTRHPFMDAPLTWRQILSRYEPLAGDPRWLVLGLREHSRTAVETPLGKVKVPLNDSWGAVPRPAAGHLEMRVRLEPSWTGRLVSLPWKAPEIRVMLLSSDAQPPRRILAATANHPFPVTRTWPQSSKELWSMFVGQGLATPAGVAFFTTGTWAWHDAEVEFYQVEWREP